jgi:hypothetical protein
MVAAQQMGPQQIHLVPQQSVRPMQQHKMTMSGVDKPVMSVPAAVPQGTTMQLLPDPQTMQVVFLGQYKM